MVRAAADQLTSKKEPTRASVRDYKDVLRRDITLIDWPGSAKNIGLMLLNCDEVQQCHLEARAWFRRNGQDVDLFSTDELEREERHQQVFRMLVDPDAKTAQSRVFATIAEARKTLLPDELFYFLHKHDERATAVVKDWGLEPADSDDMEQDG